MQTVQVDVQTVPVPVAVLEYLFCRLSLQLFGYQVMHFALIGEFLGQSLVSCLEGTLTVLVALFHLVVLFFARTSDSLEQQVAGVVMHETAVLSLVTPLLRRKPLYFLHRVFQRPRD